MLTCLCDAYHEEEVEGAKGIDTRVVMKFNPQLAPIKVAVMPLVNQNGIPEKACSVVDALLKRGTNASYDRQHAIGKRYRRHNEISTPWCLATEGRPPEDNTMTIRDQDTMEQRKIDIDNAVTEIEAFLRG